MCQDIGCREAGMQECQRYGKFKAVKFYPVRYTKRNGELIQDHCYLKDESRLYFNQYRTGGNASVLRKKLCVCRGLFK